MSPAEFGAPAALVSDSGPFAEPGEHPEEQPEIRLSAMELREWRSELLDADAWAEVLDKFGRTMRLAVALTNSKGKILGKCHNPQPVWAMARQKLSEPGTACNFCLAPWPACTAVADALKTGTVVLVHDQACLAHIAVPLILGGRRLGTLIAGQVFDRYPEPLALRRIARDFGISQQDLWHEAVHQAPVSHSTLEVYGDLLASLGHAFLRERYAAILHRKLAETNRRYRLMIEGAKDHALFTVNAEGSITSWNPGAERLLGYTEAEILHQDFRRFFTPEDIRNGVPAHSIQVADKKGWIEEENAQVRKDGTRFFSETVMASLGKGNIREFGRLVRDVTERRKSADALLQAQKMESIGVLAGGIAHDFNNLLTGILGNVSMAVDGLPPDHPSREMLDYAVNSSQRAASLVSQLLAYTGKGHFVIGRFDLSKLVSEIIPLITTSIPKKVQLHLSLLRDLPWIEADASEIQQIVMNLVINGAESIGPEGGTVRISTGLKSPEPEQVESQGLGSVYLEVKDSGSGMDALTQAKIFDPFFTTKFTGRGLGLAAVSGIVRRFKGQLQVESTPGAGSTFSVSFPAVKAVVPFPTPKPPSPVDLRGTGAILIVDDESLIRKLAQTILEGFGYSVLLAENGKQAVEIFGQNSDGIAAVLLDFTMPVMDGIEAFNQFQKISPIVPVIISTGHRDVILTEKFEGTIAGILEKPYTPAELGTKMAFALKNFRKASSGSA
jgi:PAS domain S-box-containing protein